MPVYTDHNHEQDCIYFARTNYRNALRKFGIKTDDRRRHMYVIGKTGMGKTTLLENMILADIYLGHGCAYIDPHGDTAEKLINYIPEWRLQDVVYLNPADIDFPMGFNILESVDESKRHVVASGLMGVFKKIWPDVWSARMEHILNNCVLTLLENPGSTLLGINRLLVDKDYRRTLVANLKDPVIKSFWLTEFEMWDPKFRTEAIAPIQNKVGQFLSASVVRNIVAQERSTIRPREIMDQNKIFIVNLSKGRIGEDAMRLLGGMLITKMQLSAMERVDMAELDRPDFYLYIDEFQNFATESFAQILSEARKYRLCLIMAHQYIEQLTEEVRAAVFGNVGTILTFRVGSPDAAAMETEFAPRFLPEDLVNLTKFQVYLRLMIDGVASEPFSATTLPAISEKTHLEPQVIAASRAAYARDRAGVEKEVIEWSGHTGLMEGGDMTAVFAKIDEERKAAKSARRPMFQYTCTRCQKPVELPVELDRSRPIYCDDCILIIRAERKGGKPSAPLAPPVHEGSFREKPEAVLGSSAPSVPPAPRPPSSASDSPQSSPHGGGPSDSSTKRRRKRKRAGSSRHDSHVPAAPHSPSAQATGGLSAPPPSSAL